MYPRSSDDPFRPTGAYLLDISTARPVGDIKFPPSNKPVSEGYTSDDYLQRTRENDPWPESQPDTPALTLTKCRILTPVDKISWDAPLVVVVDVTFKSKPTTARVEFELFYCTPKKPEAKRWSSCKEEGFIEKIEGLWQARTTLLLKANPETLPGDTVDFQVRATHVEGGDPVWSDTFKITCQALAAWLGGQDLTFESGSAFPRLGEDGNLVHLLKSVVDNWTPKSTANDNDPKSRHPVAILGFAESGTSPNSGVDANILSHNRAKALAALLERNEVAWADLATKAFATHDLQWFLSDLHKAFGWACQPGEFDGKVGHALSIALDGFRAELGRRTKGMAMVDHNASQTTWRAVHKAILHLVDVERCLPGDQDKAIPWKAGYINAVGFGESAKGKLDDKDAQSAQVAILRLGQLPNKAEDILATYPDPAKVERHKLAISSFKPQKVKAKTLNLGLFFDGTGNHREHDEPKGSLTNVAKLYDLYPEIESDDEIWTRQYFLGIGTTGSAQGIQQAVAVGFADRAKQGLGWLKKMAEAHPLSPLRLRLFGFSRGAAIARNVVNALHDPALRAAYGLMGRDIVVELLGIFDTVGSVGIPGNGIDLGFDLTVRKGRVKKVIHLVAMNEVRAKFDVWSIRCPMAALTEFRVLAGSPLSRVRQDLTKVPSPAEEIAESLAPEGWAFVRERAKLPDPSWEEWLLPGMHADVGGGYGPNDAVPAFDTPAPIQGESINAYVYRVLDERIHRGDSLRGVVGAEEESPEEFRARLHAWRETYAVRQRAARPDLEHLPQVIKPPDQDPQLVNLGNDLSRIALWVMIERCKKAGVSWKGESDVKSNLWNQIQRFPSTHSLHKLSTMCAIPDALEHELSLNASNFPQIVVSHMHDSRWAEDFSNRTRDVYFGGRT